MKTDEKLNLCSGCRNDFYNGHNELGVKRCWSFKTAKVVRRWRLAWWTAPTKKGAFTEVKTLSCHHAPGKYAHYEKLPSFAESPHPLAEIESPSSPNTTNKGEI